MRVNIDYLRRLRRQKNMKLSDVAQLVGKDRSTIWRYENGVVEMPTDVLFTLADYYQVSVDSLRWAIAECKPPAKGGIKMPMILWHYIRMMYYED